MKKIYLLPYKYDIGIGCYRRLELGSNEPYATVWQDGIMQKWHAYQWAGKEIFFESRELAQNDMDLRLINIGHLTGKSYYFIKEHEVDRFKNKLSLLL